MEIFIMLATAVGLNAAAIGVSASYFKGLFIAEEKFHVLTDGGQVRVVQGKRRTPLKVSEAEAQLAVIKRVARRSAFRWPSTLWQLYGPKNTRKMDSELDVIRRHAVESQRSKLLVDAMRFGYEPTTLMATIMKVSSDAHFEKLRYAIPNSRSDETLQLAASIEGEIRKTSDDLDGKEIVLLDLGKAPRKKAIAAAPAKSGGVPLPEGYQWSIDWENRAKNYEKMVVLLKNPRGEIIGSDSFYTGIWGTPERQRTKVCEIQKELAYGARHDMDPSGVAPEIRALL